MHYDSILTKRDKVLLSQLESNNETAERYKQASRLGLSDAFIVNCYKQGLFNKAVDDAMKCKEHFDSKSIELSPMMFEKTFIAIQNGVEFYFDSANQYFKSRLDDIRQTYCGWRGRCKDISLFTASELVNYAYGVGEKSVEIFIALGYVVDDRKPEPICTICGIKPHKTWLYCPFCGTKI